MVLVVALLLLSLNLDFGIVSEFPSLELLPPLSSPPPPSLGVVVLPTFSTSVGVVLDGVVIISETGNKRDMRASELNGRVYAVSVVVNIVIVLVLLLLLLLMAPSEVLVVESGIGTAFHCPKSAHTPTALRE